MTLSRVNNGELVADLPFSGLLQLIKLPLKSTDAESIIDAFAGTFVRSISVDGGIDDAGGIGRYSLSFEKVGEQKALMYALPHHIKSFDERTRSCVTDVRIDSQTNGTMMLVVGDIWSMEEPLPPPSCLEFLPRYPPRIRDALHAALDVEGSVEYAAHIDTGSMYFAGKAISKVAQLALLAAALQHPSGPHLLDQLGISILKFVRNSGELMSYDSTWGGIVSNRGFVDGDMADFGNTWYNDHHYHFGYHIYAAAAYLHLNPFTSVSQEIQQWTELLIRDVASPCTNRFFPQFRNFDWWTGHSWSKGLFSSGDGKDEESSSEDYHFTYACFLYALAAEDGILASRSKLMLAIQKNSVNHYMLFAHDNTTQPRNFVGNRVSGIKFQNKIDHATYFGLNPEYIHGKLLRVA